MKRKSMIQLLILLLLGMGVLFSLVAFDLPGSRREPELLEITVLLREADSSVWSAARQGMDQAAEDFGAELRLLTLGTAGDAAEQADLLRREVEGGADGIILVPADPVKLASAVEEAVQRTAVVTMESTMAKYGASACISVDNIELGTALGRIAQNGTPEGEAVLLINSAPKSAAVFERLDWAESRLQIDGRETIRCTAFGTESLSDVLTYMLQHNSYTSVLAFEPSALEMAARVIQTVDTPPLLYGMGATSAIASHLEQGSIMAVAAQNEFSAGYLAVQAAAQAARRQNPEVEPLAFSLVRKENMYEPEMQKLLFPVTR